MAAASISGRFSPLEQTRIRPSCSRSVCYPVAASVSCICSLTTWRIRCGGFGPGASLSKDRLLHRMFPKELLEFTLHPYSLLGASRVGNTIALTTNGKCYRRSRKQWLSSILCATAHGGKVGRVGTHDRQGNVSLASFGIRPRKSLGIRNMDFTKSLSGLLPYVVVATAIAALVQPSTFAWVSKEYYAPALGGIMLSIGVQLSLKDFSVAFKRPKPVLAGYIAQYGIKPFLGVFVARAFNIPCTFASGFILTASVAGAQLSSYASYLSEGDVALSIVLTSLSTITSVVVTPVLTGLLIGSVVPVNGVAMAKSILQVVLCPVMMGLALNTYAKPVVDMVRPLLPIMAMICTSMCIGSPLALNRGQIASIQGAQLLLPVIAFHVAAFTLGYWMSKLPALRLDEKASRTLSLCTGMQSSTLAGLLACQFLGDSQAVPPACSVVVMAVMGLSLASFWGSGNRICNVLQTWRSNLHPGQLDKNMPSSLRGLR